MTVQEIITDYMAVERTANLTMTHERLEHLLRGIAKIAYSEGELAGLIKQIKA